MKKERRKRMVRPHTPVPFSARPIDLAILSYLTRYRLLRGKTVYELVATHGFGREWCNKRLRVLFEAHLIDKISNQPGAKPDWNSSDIYQVSKKGLEYLREHPHTATNLQHLDITQPIKDFRHTLMICDALASIEIGVAETDCTFIPQGEIVQRAGVESLALPYSIRYRFGDRQEKRESKAIPDGIFGIQYPDGKSRLFLLEAEHWSPTSRTTLTSSSTFRKVLAYQDIYKRRKEAKIYGKRAFNVLFVFPTVERAYNAREMVREQFGEEPLCLFQTQPVQEQELRTIKPNPGLFTGTWLRPGLPDISISEPI